MVQQRHEKFVELTLNKSIIKVLMMAFIEGHVEHFGRDPISAWTRGVTCDIEDWAIWVTKADCSVVILVLLKRQSVNKSSVFRWNCSLRPMTSVKTQVVQFRINVNLSSLFLLNDWLNRLNIIAFFHFRIQNDLLTLRSQVRLF